MTIELDALRPAALLRRVVRVRGFGAWINLDEESRRAFPDSAAPNVLLDPEVCGRWVRSLHAARDIEWSWGGYGEDRRWLWRGSYIEENGVTVHAGIDLNVDIMTAVTAPCDAQVIRVDDDTPEEYGWGPRVVLQPKKDQDLVLLFAHLAATNVVPGDRVCTGATLGYVGVAPGNGNWYPHLHLQAVNRAFYLRVIDSDPARLDGYYSPGESEFFKRIYPDPLEILAELAEGS